MNISENMKNIDIRTVEKNTLVDVESVNIDKSLSPEERQLAFIEQIKNPYCYICNGFIVKSKFAENGKDFNECFENYVGLKL